MRAFLMILISSVTLAAQTGTPQVSSQDLLDGLKDPTRWLTNGGEYNGQRSSPLTQMSFVQQYSPSGQWQTHFDLEGARGKIGAKIKGFQKLAA